MDTAKVDIRKLQLLNDRINQTIDALNQVRFSVHGATSQGLSHTGTQGFGQTQNPYGGVSQGLGATGVSGIGNPAFGLAHSAIPQSPFGSPFAAYGQAAMAPSVFGNPLLAQNPMLAQNPLLAQNPMLAQNPALFGLAPFLGQGVSPFGPGLQHSGGFGFESSRGLWGDPYLAAQIAQTFPYAQSPVPPVVTIS